MVENLVLDVGCGDRPKGNVNLDLSKGKTSGLQGFRGKINPSSTLNFVQGTVYNLPFRDNAFNKVLCHHLLEHLEEPKQAVKELVRVSKNSVEIIVPYKWHELIQNWFLPSRRQWASEHHLRNYGKKDFELLFSDMKICVQVRLQYKFLAALRHFRIFHIRSFREFFVYGILEAVLPPTPGELIASITKTSKVVKPMARAK